MDVNPSIGFHSVNRSCSLSKFQVVVEEMYQKYKKKRILYDHYP